MPGIHSQQCSMPKMAVVYVTPTPSIDYSFVYIRNLKIASSFYWRNFKELFCLQPKKTEDTVNEDRRRMEQRPAPLWPFRAWACAPMSRKWIVPNWPKPSLPLSNSTRKHSVCCSTTCTRARVRWPATTSLASSAPLNTTTCRNCCRPASTMPNSSSGSKWYCRHL